MIIPIGLCDIPATESEAEQRVLVTSISTEPTVDVFRQLIPSDPAVAAIIYNMDFTRINDAQYIFYISEDIWLPTIPIEKVRILAHDIIYGGSVQAASSSVDQALITLEYVDVYCSKDKKKIAISGRHLREILQRQPKYSTSDMKLLHAYTYYEN